MPEFVIENNQATVMGRIVNDFSYSHEIFGEGFYMMDVYCRRLSGSYDVVPVMVSDRMMDISEDYSGRLVCVSGQFRSYNFHGREGRKNKLQLFIFAREISYLDVEPESHKANQVYLEGYVCKEPVYRRTPQGREITDLMLAVNRPYGKTDYLPCICWGRNARYAGSFRVGGLCSVRGRIQSREYIKKLPDESTEKRVAYEVSVSKIELFKEGEE